MACGQRCWGVTGVHFLHDGPPPAVDVAAPRRTEYNVDQAGYQTRSLRGQQAWFAENGLFGWPVVKRRRDWS
ncbi:hypothetical protein E4U54_008860 [Claviceps lovelessii]|nr:hypothetical protein E4U54_008860 [Claviceps lovelessii]